MPVQEMPVQEMPVQEILTQVNCRFKETNHEVH